MSNFTFTATAECGVCGEYLSSSDSECDHNGRPVETHVFRKIGDTGKDSLIGVDCTIRYKWDKLQSVVGDSWIEYEWLGTQRKVNVLLDGQYNSIGELPSVETSIGASFK